MSEVPAKTEKPAPLPPRKLDPVAGVLSYLIPGLGQVLQGRIAKGVVFFVSLYALFFYGMYLGRWRNVYSPETAEAGYSRLFNDLYNRPHFAGQFFIGVAAWPAIFQYMQYDPSKDEGPFFGKFMRAPLITRENGRLTSEEINKLQRDDSKTFDLGWVYTVIAGVLNILVIYDAIAGPAFREALVKDPAAPKTEKPATA
jgi:hypothetical protein